MIEAALKYHSLGFRVIPVKEDKRPMLKNWKRFQESQTAEDVKKIFSQKNIYGIAILTGIAGLECIDIDCKYDLTGTLFNAYTKHIEQYEKIEIMDLVIQSTVSSGFHFFYKCSEIGKNEKLARRPLSKDEMISRNGEIRVYNAELAKDQMDGKRLEEVFQNKLTNPEKEPKVLLETRGVGGYVLVYPSKGYSVDNGSFLDVPTISIEQRNVLINSAKSFDEIHDKKNYSSIDTEIQSKSIVSTETKTTCWDAYNQTMDFVDLLKRNGWKELTYKETDSHIFFRRPGKNEGVSADYHKVKRLFKCWSTSTNFEAEHAYTHYGVYCLLEHGGNTSEAAKTLYRNGYGTRFEPSSVSGKELTFDDNNIPLLPEVVQAIQDNGNNGKILKKFDINSQPEEIDPILTVKSDGKIVPVAGKGMLGAVVGMEKSRKTTALSCIVASDLKEGIDNEILNFTLNLEDEEILWFDTEQPEYWFWKTHKRIYDLARQKQNIERYHAFFLREYSVKERCEIIAKTVSEFLAKGKKIGLIVVDGIVDICENFNDEKASTLSVQFLMTLSAQTGALAITVLHLTKGMGFMKGHLGSILGAKCDFTIEVEKKKSDGLSYVKSRLARFQDFKEFSFGQVDDGIPILSVNIENNGCDELGRMYDGYSFSDEPEEKYDSFDLEEVSKKQKETSNKIVVNERPDNDAFFMF